MLETALDLVKFMEMEERQVVMVEHTDTAHPHVHFTVNMIHPENGVSLDVFKDEYRLNRWCDNYELKMGVIRSPERRAKFAALDQGLDPPPRKKQPKHYNNPAMKDAIANDNKTARERAQALRDGIAAWQRRLKETQSGAWKRRKSEERQLWNDYRTAREAIRARHKFEIDKIIRHKRNRNALPLSIRGFRDWKETREWKALMERLKAKAPVRLP
jgi:relaxase-like protein